MEAITKHRIDAIFNLLEKFYEDRWTKRFSKNEEIELEKNCWLNCLKDLTYPQLRNGLMICSRNSKLKFLDVPTAQKFKTFCLSQLPASVKKKNYLPNVPRRT